MTGIAQSAKKAAQMAAKMAERLMSDKAPAPVELGGAVEKQPTPGAVISAPLLSAPPLSAPPLSGPAPDAPVGNDSNGL